MPTQNRSGSVSVASAITATVFASSSYFMRNDVGVARIPEGTKENISKPCVSAFQLFLDDPIEVDAADRALSLIQNTYHQGYHNSSISHHYFVRTAPVTVQDSLSKFVWSNASLKKIQTKVANAANGEGIKVIPDVFDEIYLMRPEFDLLDDKKVHYDGNLKIPGICTIRALTYLSGKDATFFALTSRKNYTTHTHSSIVLDFDREMHYVSLTTPSVPISKGTKNGDPRVMVKSVMHVILPGTHPMVAYLRIVLHRIMVFAARTFRRAFESKSHSPSNESSKSNISMMAIDNLMRSMNKIHMALPILIIGFPLGAIFLSPAFYPSQFLSYVVFIIARCLFYTDAIPQTFFRCMPVLIACAVLGPSILGPRRTKRKSFCLILFHIAWVGVCLYVEANASMANKILLAPWQQVVSLDEIT